MKCFGRLLFVLMILGLGLKGYSQEEGAALEIDNFDDVDLFSMSLEELLNIELTTGSFLNLDLENSPLSMTIISEEQITASGARHLTEALEIYVPGFQYMVNKWNGLSWGMRGVSNDRTTKFIFLVNGHKMNTESRDGASTELDLGLLSDVKRIEVLRGPASIVYGSGAIAGVVNIVTKEFEEDMAEVSAKIHSWSMETYGYEVEGAAATSLNEEVTARIDFGFRKSDGVGMGVSRLYGRPSWPYPQGHENPPQNGVPSMGSAWSTPGNNKLGLDLTYKNVRIYSRWTHQVTNASGWFVVDPWPEVVGSPTEDDSDRMVDGYMHDHESFFASTESYNNNRRQYVYNNLFTSVEYKVPVGSNEVILNAGADAMTNRIQYEDMKAYYGDGAVERKTLVGETFGERRYDAKATYLVTSIDKLQFAVGYEFRYYDIGDDMAGNNSQSGKALHPIVSDVDYFNNAVFGEGMYQITPKLDAHLGLRYDAHTRTIDHGGTFNPKVGLVFKPADNHSIKLVYQESSNNGSADNYEFNRNSIGDDGKPFAGEDYHYDNPTNPQNIIPPVTNEMLHELKPERSQSVELMTFHRMNNLVIMPSVSYNTVSNIFAWNQSLFRVINAGKYSFINIDLDVQYSSSKVTVGANHTIQQLVGMDVAEHAYSEITPVFDGYDSTLVDSEWYYTPRKVKTVTGEDSTTTATYNSVRDGVTVDGTNFLSLNTHVSKLYVDYKPQKWCVIHMSARVFWGLKGRQPIHEFDPTTNTNEVLDVYAGSSLDRAKNYSYMDMHKSPMVKMNLGLVFGHEDKPLRVSLHVYDLLAGNGSEKSRHSLRWTQGYNAPETTDLYAMDLRSYAVKLTYKF